MIISKLHREFPRRVVEWGMGYMLITWGVIVLLADGHFEQASQGPYESLMGIMPEDAWGLLAFCVGATRLSALYVNGAHRRSPVARTLAGFLSMFIWFCIVVGLFRSTGPFPIAIAIYPWLMVGDAYAVYTAAGDAYAAEYVHKRESQGYASRG